MSRKPPPARFRGTMVVRECMNCHGEFQARQADVNRGWGHFCSKRCKAADQEKRTGQYAALRGAHGVHGIVATPLAIAGDLDDIHDLDDPL